MKKILSIIPTEDQAKERFLRIAEKYGYEMIFSDKESLNENNIGEYEILLGTIPLPLLIHAHSLRYLHLPMAGSNTYVKEGLFTHDVLITNSTGAFGHAISEHLLAMQFEIYKKLHLYRDNQLESNWKDEGSVRSLYGTKVLVVGLGDIGSEYAKKANALGMKVSGMRRTTVEKPEYIEKMYPFGSLGDIIGDFDTVVLALPETPDTIHILNAEIISKMKDGAIVLNVGRGSAIDTESLCNALTSGKLSGCGLDVTDPEPLPENHPLWKIKTAVITPHVSGFFHLRETYDNITELALSNLELFLSGNTPKNIVDKETGYRKI